MPSGLKRLQKALDENTIPDTWPQDVCRDAFCGQWERNNGQYYWHRASDHEPAWLSLTDCPGGLPWGACHADDCGVREDGRGCALAAALAQWTENGRVEP